MRYNKLKKILFSMSLIMFFLNTLAYAQEVDSLNNIIDNLIKAKETGAVKIKSVSADYQAVTLKINLCLSNARKCQNNDFDSLLIYSKEALKNSLKLGNIGLISGSVEMLGNYYIRKEDYENAGKCYLLSLKIEEKNQNRKRIADLNTELGIVYFYREVFSKSFSYLTNALVEYEKEHDTLNMAKVNSYMGNLYSSREYCEQRSTVQKREDFNKAIQCLEKSKQLGIKLQHQPLVANCNINIGAVYNKLEHPEKALPYLTMAVDYFRKSKHFSNLTGALHTQGITYFKLKQYGQSTKCFEEALKTSLDNNLLDGIHFLYESMAQTFEADKDYRNAYDYYIKYMTVKDSLNNMQKSKELNELETRYQSEKKENEIVKLTSQKREKNLMLYSLSGLILILCVLGYYVLKNIKNKKLIAEQTVEIKEQHIQELEKERQLIATKSVLKGEESERSRMARDLHDGLGGLLSGVKINLSSMKGNSVISSEGAIKFDQAIKLLDTSIIELRRVAHSLMPETLNHYGLKTALNDFIGELSSNTGHILSFNFFGEDIRYNPQLELALYRIAQELVNNALKHSGANNIDFQLIAETKRVCIQVIDNGKGFDRSTISGDGKGLVSIRERVASNNGRFEIESSPGNGTEATVELFI